MEYFSKNRQAILECLQSTTIHPTAEWLYEKLRPEYPNLSLGTVYRNLVQLKESGRILSLGVIAGEEHFDGNIAAHGHVICPRCGRVDDIPFTDSIRNAMEDTEQKTGFCGLIPHFIGQCEACREEI